MTTDTVAIGKRPIRHDGVDKVTGRAQYGNDVKLAGTLYAHMLRSAHAHARILSIDTSAAGKLPGVQAVVTSADMPDLSKNTEVINDGEGEGGGLAYMSQNMLARGKVLYHGHAIAAVAATSASIAEEACKLIKVDYEILPPLLSTCDAMKDDAPIIHAEMRTEEAGKLGDKPSNVAKHMQLKKGDMDAGFAEADVVVEREFFTKMVHQGYIEPHATTVLWKQDGTLSIWASTQSPWGVRREVSELLQVPQGKIKVTPTEIGGGFGGKLDVYLEPVAAILSKKAGYKPVKMAMSRADVLMATGPTSGGWIKVKMGVKKNGEITAAQAWMEYEAGAFPGSPVGAGMGVIFGPYRLPNVQIDGYDVIVNKPKTMAYRAPGGTNAAYASESVVDELAEKIGMDPLRLRQLNGAKEGDRRVDGPTFQRVGYLETVQAAINSPHYEDGLAAAPATNIKVGRGVASGFWFNWGGKSSCNAAVNPDGSITLSEGSADIGGTRTSISMQLAEVLGIGVENIKPAVVDTDSVGYNDATGGSRTTFGSGLAAFEVGTKIKQIMIERAAKYWEIDAKDVTLVRGVFKNHSKQMTFAELAAKLDETGGQVVASAATDGKGGAPAFGTHVVDVAVDTETGKVQILRYTAVQDVGHAIYPPYVEGQIQGGVSQGVGWALHEEYFYNDKGLLLNASLLDYRMPTALDLPMIETILVEVASPNHPYGVRGVGEVPIVPPAAAVANAIHNAIGVRVTNLPMSPGEVLRALGKI